MNSVYVNNVRPSKSGYLAACALYLNYRDTLVDDDVVVLPRLASLVCSGLSYIEIAERMGVHEDAVVHGMNAIYGMVFSFD